MQKNARGALCSVLMVLGLFFCGSLQAQQQTISGNVIDVNGEPIIGATVQAKGTSTGTVTDVNGHYTVSVPASATTLVVSYVGFETREMAITGNVVNVALSENATALNEVVVIGYGTVRRRDLTGSVSSVGADAIAAIPVASAAEAITGKMAGVQITTLEGSPDTEIKIRVRGGGSITGDNMPLYIVDGFPVESISDVPPGDIESIDVLKDASSTAIYGSRGANGVIIITTKSGKEGKINVSYNAYIGWKKIAKKLDVLSPYDYALWQYERAMLADGKPDKYVSFFGNFQDIDLYKDVTANDWQEQVFGRTGFTNNHNLSINGGAEKSKYAFSYNHLDDKAIMQLSSYKRDNLSLKLNNKPTDKFTLDFSVRFSNTEIRGGGANEVNEVSSADSRLKYAMIYPPFPVSGLTDEGETDDAFNLYHPLTAISDNDRLQKRRTLNMNGSVAWEIIKNLRVKAELGWDDYRNDDTRFYGSTTYFVKNVPKGDDQGKPAIRFVQRGRDTYRSTNTINYDFKKILKDGHNLNVLAGQEYILKKEQHLTSEAFGFPKSFSFDDAYKLSAEGNANTVKNFIERDDILLSWFGRANYDFGGKYLLSAAFRADGSSKFKKGNKWGFFPSAAGAWRISSEPFMEPTKDWLDDLKLRFSYGTAGNNKIPSGLMDQLYVVTGTNWVNGFGSYWAASKTMANPDLVWETTVTRNLGLDITTLNGRLSGSVEVYLNTTKDLLIMYPVSGTGYESQYRNMGDTQNKGIEGTVNWTIISKKNVEFGISANIGFNKNKVISLGLMDRITGDPVTSGWASTEIGQDFITEVGMPVGLMYGYLSDGRYDVNDFDGYDEATDTWILKEGVADASGILGTIRPGTMKLKKTNKLSEDDYLVRIDDRTVIGDTNPLHTGGFTLNGRVYGFDLSASFNWSYGNDVYNANKVEYTSTSKYHSRNMISEMESGKRWTNLREDGTISNDPTELAAMNANTTMWSPYMKAFTFTDWAVEDGSFLRLNTLTLGYSLPKAIIDKVKIQNLRLYVTGYNLFCWTNYSGFDPEVSTRRKTNLTPNVDYSAYPKSRSFVVGLNLSF